MREFKTVDGVWIVEKTTALFGLRITGSGALKAPEGKLLTMTLNTVQTEPLPGDYEGDIVITVTEPICVGAMAKSNLRAALYIGPGGPEQDKSVLAAARAEFLGNNRADSLTVQSLGDCFSGVFFDSDGDYTINELKLDFVGSGNNESVGEGAGVAAYGSGTLTLNRANIRIRGAARSAIFGGGDGTLVVNDSYVHTSGGRLPQDYKDSIAAGAMKRVPWMLGLRGNNRATNLAERSTAVYNNCTLLADEWGVMSTDGVERTRLTMNNCHIGVLGKSGYGAFALMDSLNTLDHCTVNVPDYAMLIANGPASCVITNETKIEAGRFAVMCFRNTSGTVKVNGGSILKTGEACFVVKGCNTAFEVDGAVLESANGVIMQLMDSDDPRGPFKYFTDNTEPDIRDPARSLTASEVCASFANMTVEGDFYNATSNKKYYTGPDTGDPHGNPPGGPGGPGSPGGPGPKSEEKPADPAKNLALKFSACTVKGVITSATARHNVPKIDKTNCEELGRIVNTAAEAVNNGVTVSLNLGTAWTVAGRSYLTALSIDETSSVSAPEDMTLRMTVGGVSTALEAGSSYVGSIILWAE